jgi:hypothetical protein
MKQMSSLLLDYGAFEAEGAALGLSETLREAAERLVAKLPEGPVVLLGRTDAALMCCAAAAMMRQWPTEIHRAQVGRAGWEPPAGAVLVEPVVPMPGLLAVLGWSLPRVDLLVLSQSSESAAAA